MIINLILLAIFLGSLFAVWYKVSQRIPKLAVVSDEAIASYLKEESSKLHFFVIEIKSFYRKEKYKEWLKGVWAKLLYRFHIILLKLDNKVTTVLKDLRTLETKPAEKVEESIIALPKNRMQEVRVRKRSSKPKDVKELPR